MFLSMFNEFLENLNLSKHLPGLPPIAYSLIYALITVVIFVIAAKVVYYLIGKKFMKIAKKTKSDMDDKILRLIHKPIYYLMILFGIRFAIQWIDIPAEYVPLIDGGLFALIVLIAFYVLAKIIDIIAIGYLKEITAKTKSDVDDQMIGLLEKTILFGVYAIGIILILGQFGIEITPLLAGLGIMGIVIAFAAQESMSNIFGGIFLMIDQSFKKGDRVDIAGQQGDIMTVGLRSTKMKTPDGNVLIIPNAELSKSKIINYSIPQSSVRKDLDFGVAYGTNIQKAMKIVEDVVKKNRYVSKKAKPRILFWEMGDFALKIRAIYWIDTWKDGWASVDSINQKVLSEFAKNKIEIPFPVTHVLFEHAKGKNKKRSR